MKEIALEKGKGYSEEITRLQKAEKYINEAIKEGKRTNLNSGLLQKGEDLLKTILNNKIKAENDNKTVYMETPPIESSLVPITPASMVKPLGTFLTDFQCTEPLLFKNVMPAIIRQHNNNFNNQMEAMIMKATTEAGSVSNAARTTLSSVGLPGSLEGK